MNTEQIKDGLAYTESPMYGVKHIKGDAWRSDKTHEDRNATITAIRTALQKRSGKAWSVTGGRGTAWGWIHIDAPPARRTFSNRERPGVDFSAPWRERYDEYDTGEPGHSSSRADCDELARLLSIEASQCSGGVGIPASYEYRREYLDRAQGKTPTVIGQPYWD